MIIYKSTCIQNNKHYIGQTVYKLKRRISCHKSAAQTNKDNLYFHNAIKKYNIDSFDWEILCKCNTTDELNDWERYFIWYYGSNIKGIGYNLTNGGSGQSGYYRSQEYKDNMSKILTGRVFTKQHKKNLSKSGKGRVFTKQHKKNLSKRYIITNPQGEIFDILGLNKFCKENDLDASAMCAISKQKIPHHKKWKCMLWSNSLENDKSKGLEYV